MKKTLARVLAVALVLVMVCSLVPSAFAGETYSLKHSSFNITVGLGTPFDEIGLPSRDEVAHRVHVNFTWNRGNYDPNKTGTYKLTGTATPDGDFTLTSSAVTATVTVVDEGFRLVLPTSLIHRNRYARQGGARRDTDKILSLVRFVDEGMVNDYDWTYRWYISNDYNEQGTYYADTKDIPLVIKTEDSYYLRCKVSMKKDGVTHVLTSNVCFVQVQGNNLLTYDYTSSVDEIVPGEPFDLTMTINIREIDGSIGEQYASGLYPQTYVFTSSNPDVTFEPNTYVTLGGSATVKVITPATLNAKTVDFNVHITGDISKNWFNELPPFDLDVPYTMTVKGGTVDAPKTTTAASLSKYFSDVTAEWAATAVDSMASNGYMNGTSSTKFSPNASMSRAMLVTTLYRMAGSPSVVGMAQQFTDVSAGEYYANAVTWAANSGIVNGTGEGKFSPNAKISREDLAAVLYRYAGSPAANGTLSGYQDAAAVSSYAAAPMSWATSAGVLKGTEGKLNPSGDATRAQVAVMLYRLQNQ